MDVPKSKSPLKNRIRLCWVQRNRNDVQAHVNAIQTDNTRVITYREPGQDFCDLGANGNAHNTSHYRIGTVTKSLPNLSPGIVNYWPV